MTNMIMLDGLAMSLDDAFDRAFQLVRSNRFSESENIYRRILETSPDSPRALHALGVVAYRQGKQHQAVSMILRALEIKPDFADAYNNLGNIYKDQGNSEGAIECYTKALEINEKHPQAHNNLGVILLDRGEPKEALECFDKALAIWPDYAEAHMHRGNALVNLERIDESVESYEHAIRLRPDYAMAHFNFGIALKKKGDCSEAVCRYRTALGINPDYTEARMNLGNALVSQGLVKEGVDEYRRVLSRDSEHYGIHSNILFTMNYLAEATAETLYIESLRWAEAYEKPRTVKIRPHGNDLSVNRRLRVGYVSPDFRKHSVSYFCVPLFAAHHRHDIELFCYGEVTKPDMTTARIEKLADVWVNTVGMTDGDLVERIRQDRIDILVDLAGHTAKNRLTVFAEKPAPVQVTWLGYPGTTGLSAIDYRLSDDIADPPDESGYHSEEIIRLPGGFLCYEPPENSPPISPPPCVEGHGITFGSFNNPAKITLDVLNLWASILSAIPASRLILKSHCFSDEATCLRYFKPFEEFNIEPGRVEFLPAEYATRDHLALYGRVDISLDPFPYNGTTTTCESLWMGAPVITLRGERHAGRVGAGILSRLGLDSLIAGNKDEYLRIAERLSADIDYLTRMRSNLRRMLAESPLCDAEGFARRIETAYRDIWKRWCEKNTEQLTRET